MDEMPVKLEKPQKKAEEARKEEKLEQLLVIGFEERPRGRNPLEKKRSETSRSPATKGSPVRNFPGKKLNIKKATGPADKKLESQESARQFLKSFNLGAIRPYAPHAEAEKAEQPQHSQNEPAGAGSAQPKATGILHQAGMTLRDLWKNKQQQKANQEARKPAASELLIQDDMPNLQEFVK